ncbi:amine oxidase catalytic domain-containing protein [Cucurbitaria berberidis CBS 394.84]|uniref:Amine oxidase n=1 Tax=Cucurbitaria berberidis CBS 394.84 TaxID=1168544 RepID=A0A9P4L6P6_9PLEO|nr:amine oxidase catalytic domain-containing protein [Cucurbitaria berberidis CBS 394.84]KAF1843293.1 amine oxidase catalytic domain-containing protein [Cucurbitaria berberidis CBS 394.84]
MHLSIFACLAWSTVVITSLVPPLGYDRRVLRAAFDRREFVGTLSCLTEAANTTTAPKRNPWAPLTPKENLAVWNLLHEAASGLNLTHPTEAKLTDNYVFWVDVLPTNKSAVLPYLDKGAAIPAKYARAIIFQGGKAKPDSQEYMIGPLPVSAKTTVEKLDYIYNGPSGGSVPYNARYFDAQRSDATDPLIASIMSNISDITQALFQGAYFGSRDLRTNIALTSGTPESFDGTGAFRNIMFRLRGSATYMTPLDFYLLIDCTGTDASLYSLKGFVTNEKFFPTVSDLRRAFKAGELAMEFNQTLDGDWASPDYKLEMGLRDLETHLAPSTLELGGKRYKFDKDNQYVEYMGWSFYLSFSRTLGIMFYDIKFKGERILYELSMQEATAQYTGNQPKAASTVYHDTHYELGTEMGTLVEGFDCPWGSTFWNISYPSYNTTQVNPNSICIFETELNFPLSRHRTGFSNDYGSSYVVKGAALIVRAIATVGNYDYMFDYSFHIDGSLEVIVRASGYLQASYYYPAQGKYGPRIQQATQGSLHDHIITYKADFDILGTSNSLQVSELKAVNQSQPLPSWFPELGTFEQMEMHIHNMKKEKQFNYAPNNQAMYVVVSPNATNVWGELRGYRIVPGHSNIHLSTLHSPWSLRNSEFAKSHLAVTRQHDNEPFANSVQNVNLPLRPQQDFSKFFDGESVEDEDLVVWFNLGMHHFTRSEDVPLTLYTEAYSSIVFAPQNFFDRAQDGDLLNRVQVDKGVDSMSKTYGVQLDTCPVVFKERTELSGEDSDISTGAEV